MAVSYSPAGEVILSALRVAKSPELKAENGFMPSRRSERVSGLLLEVVAETLLREVKDPRLQGVTLTGVKMSPDLKLAKIFFTTRQEEEQTEVLTGLRKATGFIKRQIANRLQLRYIPALEFRYDETLETVNHLESLLRQAAEKERESLD